MDDDFISFRDLFTVKNRHRPELPVSSYTLLPMSPSVPMLKTTVDERLDFVDSFKVCFI